MIRPTISSDIPFDMAYGGKKGVTTEREEHIKKLQISSKMKTTSFDITLYFAMIVYNFYVHSNPIKKLEVE